jgi:triosephosphate isomerase
MKKIIIANYKMNPLTLSEAIKLAKAEDWKNLYIAPPSIFLTEIKKNLQRADLAAQDVSVTESAAGALTGEISAFMLKKSGVKLVLVGHSERRATHETDTQIASKIKTALAVGLKVVLCVGEPLSIRQKGLSAVKIFLEKQIVSALSEIQNSKFKIQNLIIAYEPIWAIGSGRPADPKDIAEILIYLKGFLNSKFKIQNSKFIYGGSVSVENAKKFLDHQEIDGLLVGGLSLKPKEFKKIIS